MIEIVSGINEFFQKLDQRCSFRQKGESVMAKKQRIPGIPSTCPVPLDAPKWAIDKDYIH